MLKKLFLAALIALSFAIAQTIAQDSASEDAKTRPNKQEIVNLMVKVTPQQISKIDAILADPSGSKTPRSDFLLCTGLAYLGYQNAQLCLGSAYENGRGIVEDPSEAYVWYAIAAESHSKAGKQAEAERDRLKTKLQSVYPSPSDDELDDQVRTQKLRIQQYREEASKARKGRLLISE